MAMAHPRSKGIFHPSRDGHVHVELPSDRLAFSPAWQPVPARRWGQPVPAGAKSTVAAGVARRCPQLLCPERVEVRKKKALSQLCNASISAMEL